MRKEIEIAYPLFERAVKEKELLCEPLTMQELEQKLFPEDQDVLTAFCTSEDGFACGHVDLRLKKRFVTMLIVDPQKRGRGAGKKLLEDLEQALVRLYPGKEGETAIELSFFNPVNFTWLIPGVSGVNHPNMPGVDTRSGACSFFHSCGYETFATQESYYLALTDYEVPQEITEKKEELGKEGIQIRVYDAEVHKGMAEMLAKLDNPLWEREILSEPPIKKGGRPILSPILDGKVYGFTGPIEAKPGERGYFAGIAVDEELRGRGVAKVLFSELCRKEKEAGAGFMTLFTGSTNYPARTIYRAAGFSVVRTWEDMRKVL